MSKSDDKSDAASQRVLDALKLDKVNDPSLVMDAVNDLSREIERVEDQVSELDTELKEEASFFRGKLAGIPIDEIPKNAEAIGKVAENAANGIFAMNERIDGVQKMIELNAGTSPGVAADITLLKKVSHDLEIETERLSARNEAIEDLLSDVRILKERFNDLWQVTNLLGARISELEQKPWWKTW